MFCRFCCEETFIAGVTFIEGFCRSVIHIVCSNVMFVFPDVVFLSAFCASHKKKKEKKSIRGRRVDTQCDLIYDCLGADDVVVLSCSGCIYRWPLVF